MSLKKTIEKNLNGLTNAKQRGNALERLDQIENKFQALVTQLRDAHIKIEERLDSVTRGMNAAITLLGVDNVQNEAKRQHTEQLEEQAAATASNVEENVKAGLLETGECVAPLHLVVIQEKSPEGNVLPPSQVFTSFEDIVPEVKALLEGKKVGEVVTLPNGRTVTVLAVYRPVTKSEVVHPDLVINPDGTAEGLSS